MITFRAYIWTPLFIRFYSKSSRQHKARIFRNIRDPIWILFFCQKHSILLLWTSFSYLLYWLTTWIAPFSCQCIFYYRIVKSPPWIVGLSFKATLFFTICLRSITNIHDFILPHYAINDCGLTKFLKPLIKPTFKSLHLRHLSTFIINNIYLNILWSLCFPDLWWFFSGILHFLCMIFYIIEDNDYKCLILF